MIGDMDLERELDRWLAAGHDVLPTRAMDAALARIELTPQRPAPRVPPRRTDPMTLLRLAAAAALLGLVTVGLLLVSGRPRDDSPTTSTRVSPAAEPSVVAPSSSPAATIARPTGTPIWTSPPLDGRFTSPSLGYSMSLPDGYVGVPATESWNVDAATEDSSPWLEHIESPDRMVTMTARSASLGRPMTTDEWLDKFLQSPNAPASGDDCRSGVEWERIPVGTLTGRYYHEPCGLLWAVVATGDRGYVFTMYFNVYDTPYLADPFEAAFKAILAGTELTPASVTD